MANETVSADGLSKSTVFVTGVAGFLGSHLADRLVHEGHRVIGCDNLVGGYVDNVPERVEFHVLDCNNLPRMRDVMKSVEVVYHCAAAPYEGLSVFAPHLITTNVVTSSSSVFSAAVACGVRRIVYLSSMARYGTNSVPFTEDMVPRPQDPYGIGKVAGEDLLRTLSQVHGTEFVIAVPHNIIGPRQKYDDPFRNVVSIMINLMLQGRQPIIYGTGNQKRCFSIVSDCVEPLLLMGYRDNVVGEVINIGPDDQFITINELAAEIARLLDFRLEPRYFPDRPQEVVLANCSASKARRLLGYEPRCTLREGLEQTIEYIRARGPRPFSYHLDLEIVNGKTPKTWSERIF